MNILISVDPDDWLSIKAGIEFLQALPGADPEVRKEKLARRDAVVATIAAKKELISKELKASRRDAQRAAAQVSTGISEARAKELIERCGGAGATVNNMTSQALEEFVDLATRMLNAAAPENPSETQAIEEALDKAHEENDALETLLSEGGKGAHNPDIDDPAPPKAKKSRAKKAPTTVTDDDLEGL